jgi:hypothetical protein
VNPFVLCDTGGVYRLAALPKPAENLSILQPLPLRSSGLTRRSRWRWAGSLRAGSFWGWRWAEHLTRARGPGVGRRRRRHDWRRWQRHCENAGSRGECQREPEDPFFLCSRRFFAPFNAASILQAHDRIGPCPAQTHEQMFP